jgi:hypothetical protein
VTTTPGGISAEQASLEAQALANLGGGTAPATAATGSELEAQALAHLGGTPSGPPATGADLEGQALQSMKTNEVEAEHQHQHQLALQREQEEQAEQATAEASQEASEPQSVGTTTGGGFLNALNTVLGTVNDGLSAQVGQQNARNAQLQAQMNAQIAANNARRAQEATQRQAALARQEEQQQQTASTSSSGNSRLCNSAEGTDSLLAQGCGTPGATSNVAKQNR